MKRKITILTTAIALFAFLAIPMGMWGQTRTEVTWTASEHGYENGASLNGIEIQMDDFITIQFDKNDGINPPAYYNTGTAVRMYPKNSLTVTPASGYQITGMTLTFSATGNTGTLGASVGTYSLSSTTGTWSGNSTEAVVLTNNATSGHARLQVLSVTYSDGTTPVPTTYTVTYDCNGGTSGCPENVTNIEPGTQIQLADAPSRDNYDFDGWSDGTNIYGENEDYTVNGNVTFTAQWTEQSSGDVQWILTNLADLTENDVFVIVGNNGSNYAMSNDKGTGSAPIVVAVTVENDAIIGTVAANIQWTVSGDATNGYTFYPNGNSENWLYCTNANNGVRVGTNDNKTFVINSDYLYNSATGRHIGIYNSQDWRCYLPSSTGVHNNIAGQTFAFYKKVTGGVVPPSITAENVSIEYNITEGAINYTINNGVEGGTLAAATESNWLTLGEVGTTVPFTCSANEAGIERTATVTLTYTYDRTTVTKDVTVTQAGDPNATMTIAEVRAQGTGDVVTTGTITSISGNGTKTAYMQDATAAIVVYGSFTAAVGDEIRVAGTLTTYQGLMEITSPSVTVISQGNTIDPELMTIAEINASTNQGWYIRVEDATVTNISGSNSQNTTIAQGNDTILVYGNLGVTVTINDIISLNGNIGNHNGVQIANPQNVEVQAAPAEPSITVTPATVNAPAEGSDGTLAITYENIPDLISFDYYFCDAEGNELEDTDPNYPDWILAEIQVEDENYSVYYVIEANEGEARTAYFKVYTPEAEDVYALVTVNQAAYVVDYATLPFEFNGGKADIENTNGLTQEGLGNDYNSTNYPTTQLKFDNTGDWLLLHFIEAPSTLKFNIKGNSFNGGTFTVQTSEDGETYENLVTYDDFGTSGNELKEDETFSLGEDVRYIKWIYTNKGQGNVGLGNIYLYEFGGGPAPVASITFNPDVFDLDAEQHVLQIPFTYENIEVTNYQSFTTHFYNAEGEEIQLIPGEAWYYCSVTGSNAEGYQLTGAVTANEGEARSAYMKVSAFDAAGEIVYSNLVTINQAGVPQQYTLTVEPFENLELITFVNDEMVMEGDGEIQVIEGYQIMLSIVAAEGYVMETLMVNGVNHVNDIADDFTYSFEMPAENVTISATAVENVPPTPGEWVMVGLNDLTENDVFVIVGVYDVDESSFAMPNNSTGAPSAVEVTMVGNTLSGDIDDNLKWNLSIGEDGYTFYPDGETETWLYCTNTNNGVRVGTNENNVFSMTSEGYLSNNATGRYIGIYNYQDWRCYTSINNNIKNQTFAFFKRVDVSEIETYTLDITGYDTLAGGYYLIASPVSMVRPTEDNGFLTETYDLYYFDQSQEGEEWRNYEAKKFFLTSGKGYLYASRESTTLTFTGVPYSGNGEIILGQGWNLIGNPYSTTATVNRDFYSLDADGIELELSEISEVNPMHGIFVEAQTENEVVLFDAGTGSIGDNEMKLNLRVNGDNGSSDFARIRFGEGSTLSKFMFNENNTKLYFTQDNEEFAVVRSNNEGEMPVNFKAGANGIYTFSVNAENMEVDYLHLIDNMTGADIDLLENPSYSFEANTNDYEQRFRLVFATTTGINDQSAETFAYFNGSEWVISNMGKATLQVVDVTGRIVSNETINGNATISTNNLSAGVYMIRLVNGNNVKVQKMVVK